jgi:predicted nucleic acid-binding protein
MPFLVESDFLVALSRADDQYHEHARRIISSGEELLLSPYCLTEINLGSRVIGSDISGFMEALSKVVEGYDNLRQISEKPSYHARAALLERKYNLSFFDSLHAAVAIEEGLTMISSDGQYGKITELSLIHPRKFRRNL